MITLKYKDLGNTVATTSVRWTTTVLACDDPEEVARFWAVLVDGEPVRVSDEVLVVGHGSCWLAAQRSRDVAHATWLSGERPVQIDLGFDVEDQ